MQAFKTDHNEGSMQASGWEWYQAGKVCKKYKCGKDASGAAFAWVQFGGDHYDCKVYTESLKHRSYSGVPYRVQPAQHPQ